MSNIMIKGTGREKCNCGTPTEIEMRNARETADKALREARDAISMAQSTDDKISLMLPIKHTALNIAPATAGHIDMYEIGDDLVLLNISELELVSDSVLNRICEGQIPYSRQFIKFDSIHVEITGPSYSNQVSANVNTNGWLEIVGNNGGHMMGLYGHVIYRPWRS